jgi:hypothetical protein
LTLCEGASIGDQGGEGRGGKCLFMPAVDVDQGSAEAFEVNEGGVGGRKDKKARTRDNVHDER